MYFFVYTLEGGAWAYMCDCGSQGMLWVFGASHLIFLFVFGERVTGWPGFTM